MHAPAAGAKVPSSAESRRTGFAASSTTRVRIGPRGAQGRNIYERAEVASLGEPGLVGKALPKVPRHRG